MTVVRVMTFESNDLEQLECDINNMIERFEENAVNFDVRDIKYCIAYAPNGDAHYSAMMVFNEDEQ